MNETKAGVASRPGYFEKKKHTEASSFEGAFGSIRAAPRASSEGLNSELHPPHVERAFLNLSERKDR